MKHFISRCWCLCTRTHLPAHLCQQRCLVRLPVSHGVHAERWQEHLLPWENQMFIKISLSVSLNLLMFTYRHQGGGANYLTVKWCGPTIEHFVLLQTFNSHKSNYKRKIIPATNINKITKTQWHIGTFLSPGADVCSQGNTCQHICVNKGDSYTCQCRMGFVLNADQRTCSRENMKCFH